MGQFDITPADPLQAQQDWRQTLARTAIMESQARQQLPLEQQQKLQLQQQMRAEQDDLQFRKQAAQLSPDMPLTDKLSKLATIAFQAGKLQDGERLLGSLSQAANRESLAAQRDANMALKESQRAQRDLAASQAVAPTMAKSQLGFTLGNDEYKAATGEDHPVYKALNGRWVPGLEDIFGKGHNTIMEKLKEETERARAAALRAKAGRDSAVGKAQVEAQTALAEERRTRSKADAKAGAGKLATPKKFEVDGAFATLKELHPDASADDLTEASKELAADAKYIQTREGGSYKDAVAKAVAQNAGKWSKSPVKVGNFALPGTGKSKYTSSAKTAGGAPAVGTVVKGYKFLGGDPSKQSSWEPAGADEGEEE